jgi:hypothetical protein
MAKNTYIEKIDDLVDAAQKDESTKKEKPSVKSGNKVTSILSGDFLAKEFFIANLGFIFFLMILLLALVAKGYYVKQLSDNIKKSELEFDDINADFVELKAKFLEETRRDKLTEKLSETALKEPTAPPNVIRVKE